MAAVPAAVCLLGPTASGKTDLALALCERIDCEIISVDSALVYRGMDIGTAKPSLAERARVPHHLIDIRDPAEAYSAAEFRRDALALIEQVRRRGRLPLLVGGTMLYFKVLRDGIAPLPAADPALRAALEERAAREGWPALHAELARVDPDTAARLHPNHSQRIQRALEVFQLAGEPLSVLQRRAGEGGAPPLGWLALTPPDRGELHRRIGERFRDMLARGLLDEVAALRARGDLHPGLASMRAVGYRQVWSYLDGEIDFDTLVARGEAATRQLAKRQFTWLRGWPELHWMGESAGAGTLAKALEYLGRACP